MLLHNLQNWHNHNLKINVPSRNLSKEQGKYTFGTKSLKVKTIF